MPGLIPLKLNPAAAGSRSSVIFPPSQQSKGHSRGQSINGPFLPVNSPMSPSFPSPASFSFPRRASLPVMPKRKTAKRSSISPPFLPMLPYTPEDWRRAIADVKKQHMSRRYRACFTRCTEIIDNVKENTDVEPAYLISLHFYAATAMEACARPLSAPSSYRDSLLQQARSHYEQATHLINNAEESALVKHRMSFTLSPSPSPSTSPNSPSGSISSRAWSSETGFSSPGPSECFSEDLNARLRHSQSSLSSAIRSPSPRPEKKVSFELPEQSAPRFEPYIRPDSPTLGFDDEYFQTGLARQELPEIPARAKTPELIMTQVEEEETTPRASKSLDFFHLNSDASSDESASSSRRSSIVEAPASRYCAHLTSLKTQLARHRAILDTIIAAPPVIEEVADVYTFRCPTPFDEGAQALDRQARIERLRKNGWQRKRFDPSRYEALRHAALAELD